MLTAINWNVIVEIAIVIVAVFGGVYISKILKSKTTIDQQDLDLAATINTFVEDYVLDDETAKKISRIIGKVIRTIEAEMTNAPNAQKEQAALDLVVESITSLGLDTPIDETKLREIIRLAVAFAEPTHPENQVLLERIMDK
jgi:hypothetical protein